MPIQSFKRKYKINIQFVIYIRHCRFPMKIYNVRIVLNKLRKKKGISTGKTVSATNFSRN